MNARFVAGPEQELYKKDKIVAAMAADPRELRAGQ